MKILICCLSFRNYTGSELYFFELASALTNQGHEVHIYSRFTDTPLTTKCKDIIFDTKEDLLTQTFDKVIFSHGSVLWDDIKNVKTQEFVNVLHSEVLDLEKPVIDNKINRYIGIRPSIIESVNVKCDLIYNPFDFNRFNPQACIKNKNIKKKIVLFPGSIDYLRYKPLQYLLNLSIKQNFKVLHVGRMDYNITHPNFISKEPVWGIERYYKQCDIVSGIFLGRTSIEGLLAGKKVLQFDVDKSGEIKKVYWHTEDNLNKFDKNNVAAEFLNE
jgi:glycosyltransferase involved in cell wall biosynthesis